MKPNRGRGAPPPQFEIPADDVERAKKFYKGIFGWKIDSIPDMNYNMITTTASNEKMQVGDIGLYARVSDSDTLPGLKPWASGLLALGRKPGGIGKTNVSGALPPLSEDKGFPTRSSSEELSRNRRSDSGTGSCCRAPWECE